MVKRILSAEVRKTSTQPKGKYVIEELTNGTAPAGEPILVQTGNRWALYLSDTDKKNACGFLETVINTADGTELVAQELEEIVSTGYEITFRGLTDKPNTFLIELKEIIPDAKGRSASGDYADEIDRIKKAGICSETELLERIDVLQSYDCSDKLIRAVLASYRKPHRAVRRPKAIYVNPYKGFNPIKRTIMKALDGKAVTLIGPKSVGKNVAVETVAWLLNEGLYMHTFNRFMTAEDIYGSKSTRPAEINGYTSEELEQMALCDVRAGYGDLLTEEEMELSAKFRSLSAQAPAIAIKQEISELTECMMHGGIYCANEMNLAESNFFSGVFNDLTDGTSFKAVPGLGKIDIHPRFRIIGTQNGGTGDGSYLGTNEQNEATMSRFAGIQFPYANTVKKQLISAVGRDALDDKYFTQCEELYKAFYNGSQKQHVVQDNCLNIRGMVSALKIVSEFPEDTTLYQEILDNVVELCPVGDHPALLAQVKDKISL